MLKLYDMETVRRPITLTYRGYDLELTHASAGWWVRVYPRSADLPILRRNNFFSGDEDNAVIQAKTRIDGALIS